MWNWINCYLSGRHDYGMWCEPGAIFLRCVNCGRRSSGWAVDARHQAVATSAGVAVARAKVTSPASGATHVLPFDRAAAAR